MLTRTKIIVLTILALFIFTGVASLGYIIQQKEKRISELEQTITGIKREVQIKQETSDTNNSGGAEKEIETTPSNTKDYMFPINEKDYFLSSPYGVRVSPFLNVLREHKGVDIGSVWRAQIVAVKSGKVITHYPPPDGYFKGHDVYGGYIVIQHSDGNVSHYAHLYKTYVREGQIIKKGEVIGRMGETGKTQGAHLHFELEVNGKSVNPLLYIRNPKEE